MLQAATREVARGLRRGMTSDETTMPAGGIAATETAVEESGFRAGEDFDLVFSPERVKSQAYSPSRRQPEDRRRNHSSSGGAGRGILRCLLAPIINLVTLEASEMAKLIGMVYRDVNIALANELARYSEVVGIDLRPVIAAANTDGEAHLLEPGIGVGGLAPPSIPTS